MMDKKLIFVINPGSTSTKMAVFENESCMFKENIIHTTEELSQFSVLTDQFPYRKQILLQKLSEKGFVIQNFSGIASRGGGLKPTPSGVYKINEQMISDLRTCKYLSHASNLGGLIAHDLSMQFSIPAYIADPVTVDEMNSIARYSGLKGIERISIWHALNQKYVARRAAKDLGKEYENCNLIVVHMGGGISVGAHQNGRVIDVNNALNGEGPFSAERAGTLPTGQLANMCFSGEFTKEEMKKKLGGKGGMVSHLGTNNAKEVEEKAENGDQVCLFITHAMIYQIAKTIGEMSAVLFGKVDAIVFTGGMAYSKMIINQIEDYISFIAPFLVYPGEDEMEALAINIYRVLTGKVEAKIYE
jgi:butyrate kinase